MMDRRLIIDGKLFLLKDCMRAKVWTEYELIQYYGSVIFPSIQPSEILAYEMPFEGLLPRERSKSSTKKETMADNGGNEDSKELSTEETSKITQQKVAAAKQYIKSHYKCQMRSLQERKERRLLPEKKLADADVSEEDQNNLLKFLEKKETEYMRLQRHRIGADDFELLTMIGKGAVGEVWMITNNGSLLTLILKVLSDDYIYTSSSFNA